MFVYQPTLDTLDLKKDKGTDYVLSWRSKGVYNSILTPFFLHNIKHFGYRTRIKFDKEPLAVERNSYVTKIRNTYTVYDLEACSRNSTSNFKNCLFGTTNTVKLVIKKSGFIVAME